MENCIDSDQMTASATLPADQDPVLPGVPAEREDLVGTSGASRPCSLLSIFREYRWRISAAYALLNLENLLVLAQPFCLGQAINGLLGSSATGLWLFVAQYFGHLTVSVARRSYDARAFNGIYTAVVARTVVKHRFRGASVSRISARSALSRAYAEFYQQHLPIFLQSVYFIGGGLLILGLYDSWLIALCLMLVGPVIVLGAMYRRRSAPLNEGLHDELEKEVDVIQSGSNDDVRQHYQCVGRWRIRLTDVEARNFAITDVFVLVLIIVALFRACGMRDVAAGDIFAIFRYIIMFVTGLDAVPLMIQQVCRLQDIGRRLREYE
jgi:ABC transporter transmembrane region